MEDVKVVYHYTSAEVLLKIVATETIWATNLRYLNDVSESEHCISLLRRRLPDFLKQHQSRNDDALESALEALNTERFDAPYVASFSAHRDSLPQWRSYCPNGNGVSIGFRVEALKCSMTCPELNFPSYCSLEEVRYLNADKVESLDSILQGGIDHLEGLRLEGERLHPGEKYDFDEQWAMRSFIDSQACVVKHPAFESEKEYRLIAPTFQIGNLLKYRCSRTTVIPYVQVHMPDREPKRKNPYRSHYFRTYTEYFIEEVVIGPTPNPDLTQSALSHLFNSKQVLLPVRKSTAPFRDL